MSTSEHPSDLISFCPVLEQILSYMDSRTVATCKLVNQRFGHVITSNVTRLARPAVDVSVRFPRSFERDGIAVDIAFVARDGTCEKKEEPMIIITNNYVRLHKNTWTLLNNRLKQRGIVISESRKRKKNGNKLAVSDFKCIGMEDGLHQILSIALLNTSIHKLSIIHVDEPCWNHMGYLQAVTDTVLSTVQHPISLYSTFFWQGFETLCNSLGCKNVSVKRVCRDLKDCLPHLNFSKGIFDLEVDQTRYSCLQPIATLIKSWVAGSIRVKKLELISWDETTDPHWFTKEELRSALDQCPVKSAKVVMSFYEIVIVRPTDGAILWILYFLQSCRLVIHDCNRNATRPLVFWWIMLNPALHSS